VSIRIIVPHRGLAAAKTRLAMILHPDERMKLAERLLRSVLAVARQACDDVVVISPSAALEPMVSAAGARLVAQHGMGLNAGLEEARAAALAEGVTTLVVLHGDLPNLGTGDIQALLDALPTPDGPIATRFAFPSAWRVCLLVPNRRLSTKEARAALPASVSRADAVFNLSHAAMLVAAVLRADGALLSMAMDDRLHQPVRARLVPGLGQILEAARAAGAFGAALSGAGPAVLAVAPARLAARVVGAMEEAAEADGSGGRGRVLRVRAAGVQIRRS